MKDGLTPIYIAVDVNNKRTAIVSMKRKINADDWDVEKRQVKKNVVNSSLINAVISTFINDLDAELMRKELLGMNLTREAVRRQAKGLDTCSDFYAFCRQQISDHHYAESTARVYSYEIKKMEKFSPSLSFIDMDVNFFKRYAKYMKDRLNNKDNTLSKSFKFIRTMLNLAVTVGGIIAENPIDKYESASYQQQIPDFLEWEDVKKLHQIIVNKTGLTETCRKVGYCFLLSCYSGLRFSDVIRMGYESLVQATDTTKRIILSTKKTKEIVSISFTEDISSVIDLIRANPIKVTNQEYNRQLKFLKAIAELSGPLHSHMGRHTFGMHCAELGMSIDDVQKLMGHTKRDMTGIYFKIKDTRLDKAMTVWNKK